MHMHMLGLLGLTALVSTAARAVDARRVLVAKGLMEGVLSHAADATH
jgi:hypothetical protein